RGLRLGGQTDDGAPRRTSHGARPEVAPRFLQRRAAVTAATSPLFEFGHYRLDTAKHVLWREGGRVPLPPKARSALRVPVAAAGADVVPKAGLMAGVGPDAIVEEATLSVTIAVLRRALGTRDDGQSWVETVPRRGYRFAGALRAPAVEPPLLLAVLPFRSI